MTPSAELNDFSDYGRVLRAVDTDDRILGTQTSIEDGWTDYLTYGISSAAVSATVGILNTGVAFGEMIGIAGKNNYIDEVGAVASFLGDDAADFYTRHKTGVDAFGFVASSLVPGLGAIKALRAAQTAGRISAAGRASTGLRNPDLVLGSEAVETAKRIAVEQTTVAPNWFAPHMLRGYAQGAKQNLAETFAFEGAVLATMNQNATLNPDDLSYIDAIGDQFWDAAKFGLFGAALGTGIDAFRIAGAVRKHGNEEWTRTASLENTASLLSPYFSDLGNGNKLMELGNAFKVHAERVKELDPTDTMAQRRANAGYQQLRTELLKTVESANNAGEYGYKMLTSLVEEHGFENMDKLASAISTLRSVETVGVTEAKELASFYAKTRTAVSMYQSGSAENLAIQFTNRQQSLKDAFNTLKESTGLEWSLDRKQSIDYINTALSKGNSVDIAGTLDFSGLSFRAGSPGLSPLGDYIQGDLVAYGDSALVVPKGVVLNPESIGRSWQIMQMYKNAGIIDSVPSLEDYTEYVRFHELGHSKTNAQARLRWIEDVRSSIQTEVGETGDFATAIKSKSHKNFYGTLTELIAASLEARPEAWYNVRKSLGENGKDAKSLARTLLDPSISPLLGKFEGEYLSRATELLADGAALLTNPKTREVAAKKYPLIAKILNDDGGMSKAWSPAKAYYNARTKQIDASTLPRLSDIDPKMTVHKTVTETTLKTAAGDFVWNEKAFTPEVMTSLMKARGDYRQWEAQWHIAARMTPEQILNIKGDTKIAADNLPILERVAQLIEEKNPKILAALSEGRLYYDDYPLMPHTVFDTLFEAKQTKVNLLAQAKAGYNEHEIAHMLNVDIDHALGKLDAPRDTLMMFGKRSYTEPEVFKLNYDAHTLKDYQGAVMNVTGASMMADAIESANKAAAAQALGNLQSLLPEIPVHLMETVNPWNSRAGMINNMRSEVGTLREIAQYVGKIFRQEAINRASQIDNAFVKHAEVFNKPQAATLRAELATVTNIMRRERYYLGKDETGKSIAIRKDRYLEFLQQRNLEFNPDQLNFLTKDAVEALSGGADSFAPGAIKLSDEVGSLLADHIQANRSFVDTKRSLAAASGRSVTLDENVLYMPPKDLTRDKYHAFVVPRAAYGESDSRIFAIYAENELQFNSKMKAIQERYGDRYQVVTHRERELYAKAKGDYDAGMTFDEVDFDTTLENKGRASELMPNLDLSLSGTLDSFRTWQIRQEEAMLRTGLEKHYHGVFDMLKRQDEYYGSLEQSSMNKTFREPATIFRDTASTMLGIRARGSSLESLWTRVNDYAGEKGSAIMETAISAVFNTAKSGRYTAQDFTEFNQRMADAGYVSPFDNIAQVVASSPDTVKSTAFPSLVKTLSNLFSTLQLRLDHANSILQTISTPILALPVLREAQEALAGSAAGAKLTAMTHVRNPATGDLEPSPMKLILNATRQFFSEDGKQFLEQLQARGIVTDQISQYLRATDMTQLNGRHAMTAINEKIDTIANKMSKFTGYNLSENLSRFIVAHSVREIGRVRGLADEELWPLISGSVDKVHGVYAGAQRPQVFQGVIGQAIGLYQTYFFNLAQNFLKYVADGQNRQALTMAAMQGSLFGVQSFPGFQTLNSMIGSSNRDNNDLYTLTNADDPKAVSAYAMYGLGSHVFGFPVDFAGRGSLETRHSLVLPTTLQDIPIVSQAARAYANITRTISEATAEDANVKMALLHGLAHNGLNRPLQGIGTIMMGGVYTSSGQLNWANANRVNYDLNEDISWGNMFARAIGTRPLNEAIVQSAYFRKAAYQANYRENVAQIGARLNFNLADGTLQPQDYGSFATQYEAAGGELQNFNAYWSRQLKLAGSGQMAEFQQELLKERNSQLGRAVRRMEISQSNEFPWTYPVTDPATLQE